MKMAATYHKPQQPPADDDLSFKLLRSIALVKEQKMGKRTTAVKTERASVSRERRIALALAEVLDYPGEQDKLEAARKLLGEMGYNNLESVSKRVEYLNEQLKAATEAQDWAKVAELGKELVKAQAGKSNHVPAAPVARKLSPRKDAKAVDTASAEALEVAASDVSGGE